MPVACHKDPESLPLGRAFVGFAAAGIIVNPCAAAVAAEAVEVEAAAVAAKMAAAPDAAPRVNELRRWIIIRVVGNTVLVENTLFIFADQPIPKLSLDGR